ncbi:MAG: helix-turn-helix domain-containing protein, partial [Desulfomonilaceae bacterium]
MKKKQDYTPNGWRDGEKRPYNNVKVNRQVRRSKDLSAGAKLVMEELVDSGASKGKSWPKLATLAAAVAQNKTTAWRHIQELEKLGYLIVERRHSTSCLYTLGPRLDSIAPKNTFKPVDKTIDVCMDANVTYAPTYTLTCEGAHTTSYAQTHVSILSKELIIPENQDAEKTISSEQNKEENKIKTNHSDTRSIKGILSEVLEFTGDNKNRGNWVQKCVSIPEDEIRAAMIQTKKAKNVRNKGAYLNRILNSKAQAEPSFSDIMH